MPSNKLTTAPAVEPVTGTELDTHLRGDGELVAADPTFLDGLISTAREYVERETRRAMITQTYTMALDEWPHKGRNQQEWWDGVREGARGELTGTLDYIEFPIASLQSVTEVRVFGEDNTSEVFADTNYYLDTNDILGKLILNNGGVWPAATRHRNAIMIDYVVGYGDTATDVPFGLKQAVLQLAGHWYENREYVKTQSDQNQAPTPMHVQRLINQWKVMKL